MTFTPYRPDWFYTKVQIPELENLQKEFLDLFWKTLGNDIPNDSGFFLIDYNEHQISSLQKLLQYYKLDNRWCTVGYSVINNGCKFGGVHYDYIDGNTKYLALNIPLLNCDGSYHVWYTGDIGDKARFTKYNDTANTIVFVGKESDNDVDTVSTYWVQGNVHEIASVECTAPMLVHVGRPHQPRVTHDRLRVLLTIRFSPELTDEDFARIVAL